MADSKEPNATVEAVTAPSTAKVVPSVENATIAVTTTKSEEEWLERERELLNQIAVLELEREFAASESKKQIKRLQVELEDAGDAKKRVVELEKEIHALKNRSESDELKKMRQKHEDLLTKAKDLLFEKTKLNKQQEVKIEALENQVIQLKEVISITKDMLEIRNSEAKHLNQRFETIELRLKAEKDRQGLMEKKLGLSQQLYAELKKEYDLQSGLFKVHIGSLSLSLFGLMNPSQDPL